MIGGFNKLRHLPPAVLWSVLAVVIVGIGVGGYCYFVSVNSIDTSSWTILSSKLGFSFKYPTDWELVDSYSYNAITVTKKGGRFFTPQRLEVYGRTEYRLLNINKVDGDILEKRRQENSGKEWSALDCGEGSVPVMLHPPYMDLYYLKMPSGNSTLEISTPLSGMLFNNVISESQLKQLKKVIERIVCTISFLSESEVNALNEQPLVIEESNYKPPIDQVGVIDTEGWIGISSSILGMSMYVPDDWKVKFDEKFPRYTYVIEPSESSAIANKASMRFQITPRMEVNSYSGDLNRMGDPMRTDKMLLSGKEVEIWVDQFIGPSNRGGPDVPLLTAEFKYVGEYHVVYGNLVAQDTSQLVSLEAFESVIKKLDLRQISDQGIEWAKVTNDRVQFSVMYPTYMSVHKNGDSDITFIGPITADGLGNWPYFSIGGEEWHVVSTDIILGDYVQQGINGKAFPGNLAGLRNDPTPQEVEAQYSLVEFVDEPVYTIAGLPTVHVRIPENQFSFATDYFYVLNYNYVMEITIVNEGGIEDWSLYKQFLDGITFDWMTR